MQILNVMMVMLGWLMGVSLMKEELKFVSMSLGEQCVIMVSIHTVVGTGQKETLFANSLDFPEHASA